MAFFAHDHLGVSYQHRTTGVRRRPPIQITPSGQSAGRGPPLYQIEFDGQMFCQTRWPALAQAAWHRASRNRSAATSDSQALLHRDDQLIAQTNPRIHPPHGWPDAQTPPANWHDVVKKLVLLMRRWGYGPRDIADAMSQEGLPTSRSRINALRGNARRVEVTPAELVVMLNSIIDPTKIQTDTDHVD